MVLNLVNPAKVKAIVEMLAPTDKTGVQRLLGLARYLSKFLLHLSDLTKPPTDTNTKAGRMVLRRDARECFPTAEGSSNSYTSAAVLQCEGTGNNPMRCVTDGLRSHPVAEWATCGLRVKRSVICRNTLRADRERVTGHRVFLREV